MFVRLVKLASQSENLAFQLREFVYDRIPDEKRIDAPIAVDQPIAKRDDFRPGNVGLALQIRRKAICRLADNLEISNYRVLDHLLAKKGVPPARDVCFDCSNAIDDVPDIRKVAFHSGKASAST